DPDERQRPQTKKENELDPNAQLEKQPFAERDHAATQLHRTGLSLRALYLAAVELTVCGQKGNTEAHRHQFFSNTLGIMFIAGHKRSN
ncbi:hypothetical protein, partial [uncultured Roseobacter sp.]